MSRSIIARGAALAATAVLALTACGGTDAEPEQQPEQGVEQEPAAEGAEAEDEAEDAEAEPAEGEAESAESEAEESESGESGAGSVAEGTVVEIGTELTDPDTGDVITIVSASRNMPTEYYKATDNPDGEMIYLEVKVVPGEQYGGVVSQQDFVVDDGGEEVNYASTADDELTAAGFEYFDGAPRRDGEATGFIPIYLEQAGETLKGAYIRPETEILGEDSSIPEFRGEFEIPAA
ncbi:hypothetical protein V1260_08285 [Brachybacterium sp. J144]|uniref:hypothetical protein n=1 Tax=Brachybacterium sp. J144 TaxID=3116487 RepID=UPI002E795437|nr:hypothetical protein [Brachybacterium sp. J144]MEE1650791.1 hypothetical protein [Brachybacterium sp. J144]